MKIREVVEFRHVLSRAEFWQLDFGFYDDR
jgi:hypothetical protein